MRTSFLEKRVQGYRCREQSACEGRSDSEGHLQFFLQPAPDRRPLLIDDAEPDGISLSPVGQDEILAKDAFLLRSKAKEAAQEVSSISSVVNWTRRVSRSNAKQSIRNFARYWQRSSATRSKARCSQSRDSYWPVDLPEASRANNLFRSMIWITKGIVVPSARPSSAWRM